jgi:hypothetical protein
MICIVFAHPVTTEEKDRFAPAATGIRQHAGFVGPSWLSVHQVASDLRAASHTATTAGCLSFASIEMA